MNIDQIITNTYNERKREILRAMPHEDTEWILRKIWDLWMYMNRFRNCDLGIYFDQDINDCIKQLNKKAKKSAKLVEKDTFRIAYMIIDLSDTGGASVTHRFMLPNGVHKGKNIENYLLISNPMGSKNIQETEMYRYAVEKIKPSKITILSHENSWVEKSTIIEDWLVAEQIDFCLATPDPIILYALASQPVPVLGILQQDCYTYTVGPGFGDVTFLISADQVYKYPSETSLSEHELKITLLPLHESSYAESAIPLSKERLGIPEDAIVSGSSNMWKSFFGDTDILIQGIAELIRNNSRYHHVFVGTPRCSDNLDVFLSRNPDVKNNIHYIGPIKNIYRLLKTLDFWVNSFPTSGGTDIEAALVEKPSIEFIANRNLNWHSGDLLRTRECDVVSYDEFVALGNRLIRDENYRKSLGKYLKSRVTREFDKEKIIREKIYETFLNVYESKLEGKRNPPNIDLENTIDYEKRIAYYNCHISILGKYEESEHWLRGCIQDYPLKPFGWIKMIELYITKDKNEPFRELKTHIPDSVKDDYRVQVMLALAHENIGELETASNHIIQSVSLTTYDPIPLLLTKRILKQSGREPEHSALRKKYGRNLDYQGISTKDILRCNSKETIPLYYDY